MNILQVYVLPFVIGFSVSFVVSYCMAKFLYSRRRRR